MIARRRYHVHVDERSGEIGWTLGSKVYRSRLETGRLDREMHYDFAVPWNEGKNLPGWRVGLPQFWLGIPRDGKLLRLDWPNGDLLHLDFFYEEQGVPGSLLCELFANLLLIPQEEMRDASQDKTHRADVALEPNSQRRRSRQAF